MEIAILDFIQENMRTAFGDAVLPFVSSLCAHGEIWILLAVLFLLFKKTRKCGVVLTLALLLDLLIVNVAIKPLVQRPRPYTVNTSVQLIVERLNDYSFPSGHSAASFAAVAALFTQKNFLRWPALVLSLVIVFSRLYLYVHYPTDVIAGMIIGTLCGIAAWKLVTISEEKNLLKKFRRNSK